MRIFGQLITASLASDAFNDDFFKSGCPTPDFAKSGDGFESLHPLDSLIKAWWSKEHVEFVSNNIKICTRADWYWSQWAAWLDSLGCPLRELENQAFSENPREDGIFYRNGPLKYEYGNHTEPEFKHFFDPTGGLQAIRVKDGKLTYRFVK